MSADRELLELAAKAAGLPAFIDISGNTDGLLIGQPDGSMAPWNPLRSLAQAKNLRHILHLSTGFDDRWKELGQCAYATYPTGPESCDSIMQNVDESGGKRAALRRAITRAAAEIGKAMP